MEFVLFLTATGIYVWAFYYWNMELHRKRSWKGSIGGSLKRLADRLVAQEKDIPDPQTHYDVLDGQTATKLF